MSNTTDALQIRVNTYVIIRDCPQYGPDAVDFRRTHNLPDDRADNRYPIERDTWCDEQLYRALINAGYGQSSYSDGHCEIRAMDGSYHFPVVLSDSTHHKTYHSATYGWRASVAPSILAEHARTGVIGPVLLAIAEDSPATQNARKERATKIAELRKEHARLLDESLALGRQASAIEDQIMMFASQS